MVTPSIKIELTQMGQTIMQKLEAYNENMEKETEAIIKKSIDDFDYEAYIAPIVVDYIKRMIRDKLSKTDLREIISRKVDETLKEYRGK